MAFVIYGNYFAYMNLQTDKIIQTARNTQPYADRDAAVKALNAFTGHRIGMIITLLYRKKEEDEDNKTDVQALVAIGVKDADECGPAGAYSPDRWENKHYPNGTKGEEFYKILFDSGADGGEGGGGGGGDDLLEDFGITTLHVGGQTTEVVNFEGEDIDVPDPMVFRSLNADTYGMTSEEEANNQ